MLSKIYIIIRIIIIIISELRIKTRSTAKQDLLDWGTNFKLMCVKVVNYAKQPDTRLWEC